jgi:hypothetical protein
MIQDIFKKLQAQKNKKAENAGGDEPTETTLPLAINCECWTTLSTMCSNVVHFTISSVKSDKKLASQHALKFT